MQNFEAEPDYISLNTRIYELEAILAHTNKRLLSMTKTALLLGVTAFLVAVLLIIIGIVLLT